MNYTYLNMAVNKEEIGDINYSQANIGNNPTINLATGRMQYVFQDVDVGIGDFAINIAHVYNSKLNDVFANKIIGLGNKWKLNLTQCVCEDNYDSTTGSSIIKYMDESGEIHRYVFCGNGKWYNDRKATSIIEKVDGNYVLSDGVGNKLFFNPKGYLYKSVSCQSSNSIKLYNYDANNRLISAYDQRMLINGVAKNRIELIYDSNGKLEKMISYVKNNQPVVGYRYEYDLNNNLIAVFNIAYGAKGQKTAEKQVAKFCYEDSNLVMIINSETDGATMLQYDESGRIIKRSSGFVKWNSIEGGMTDSSKNRLSLSDKLNLGLSCDADYIEKSYNAFAYRYIASDDNVAVEADVTNECKITIRYFIDRNACITSSFEVDKWFSKSGVNLKTLTKFEGQEAASTTTSELGYINGCNIFLTKNGQFSRTLTPQRLVDNMPTLVETNFNYTFWLKIKKKYDFLEVKATYKPNGVTNPQVSERTFIINPKAVDAWQQVIIPVSLTQNYLYNIDLSFLVNKNACKDEFEICSIGMAPSPCAELMVAANNKGYLPLSTVKKTKLTIQNFDQIYDIGASFYMTETDVISTYTNKCKKSGAFDVICNNGTKRITNITNIQYYFPIVEWSNYTGNEPFYIHTILPVKDAYIKTYYRYEENKSGFVIKNEYGKKIDGTSYQSSTSVKMDYLGKTIYEQDEYGITQNYEYDALGNLLKLSVVNGASIQSIQNYEYDSEGKLVSLDDGLTKQIISYNDVSQSQKIKDYSYEGNAFAETGHSLTSCIGIFRDKQVCATEYDGMNKIGSVSLTYEKGLMRTISDGLVKYGVQHNLLQDSVLYTQFDGKTEKPIQLDAVSEYWQLGGKYYKTHTSKFYDAKGKIVDGSSIEIDAYGKPKQLSKGVEGTYNYDSGNVRERYSYTYKNIQESEFTKKPSIRKNLDDYSTTEYQYNDDGNLIGWKEKESNKTVFEVRQIAPATTKYTYGNNDQEYFVQINHDKDKMASPRVTNITIQEDTKKDVDRPSDMFQVDYKWVSSDNLAESKTPLSTEAYSYLNLRNNLMLQKMEYNSRRTVSSVTWRTEASDSIDYYDNGLIKRETIKHQNFRAAGLFSKTFDPITSVRTYQYDNFHRITQEINSGLNVTRTYSYYSDGRLKKISGFRSDDVRTFVYDSKGRLTSINDSTSFAYDHFGNRISKTVNGVKSTYTYDVGGRLVEAGGVKYSYNADGIRCKKTCLANGIGERMYLDGGKILGEDRANYKLRYFYDATGLKRIRKIKGNTNYDYECVKDSQGSIIMLVSLSSGAEVCRYEYDALGKCTILDKENEIGDENPFRWKGFFYDSETGFYYANGSYYDPETGLYVDAAPVSTVFDNSGSARYIDRNGISCYNHLALASSPFTAAPTVEMEEDPSYDPGKTWWEKIWGQIYSWWKSIPNNIKVGIGIALVVVSIALAFIPGGQQGAAFIQSALIQLAIGVGVTTVGWVINSAITGNWNTNSLEDAVADAIFFTGVSLFIQSSISVLKYTSRSKVKIRHARESEFTPEAWERIQSLKHRSDGSTISSIKDGQFIHKGFKTETGSLGKELYKKGIGRFDYFDEASKTIFELKPNNSWSIARGIQQLNDYNVALGGGYKLILVLY